MIVEARASIKQPVVEPSSSQTSQTSNRKVGRRRFLKLGAAVVGSLALTACGVTPTPNEGKPPALTPSTVPDTKDNKLQIPTISTAESAEKLISADKEVMQRRPFKINNAELQKTAQQIGLKRIDLLAHFSRSSDRPNDIWLILAADDKSRIVDQMYLSVPVAEKSTGWDASYTFYAGIVAWASMANPGKETLLDAFVTEKINGIASNGPFMFKDESLPLQPPATPMPRVHKTPSEA